MKCKYAGSVRWCETCIWYNDVILGNRVIDLCMYEANRFNSGDLGTELDSVFQRCNNFQAAKMDYEHEV
jgi:hypothetical protein